jgi:hypothetical protein
MCQSSLSYSKKANDIAGSLEVDPGAYAMTLEAGE